MGHEWNNERIHHRSTDVDNRSWRLFLINEWAILLLYFDYTAFAFNLGCDVI